MGKKKSVALMVLFTIVIIALCGLLIFPSIPVGMKIWKPVVSQYDFSTELDGGYYAYYYPEGVIPETEYNDTLQGYQELVDGAETDDERADAQKELDKYVDSYQEHKGLYLSTDESYAIFAGDVVSDDFKADFKKVANEIAARYAQKEYSDYRVSVVDDYALRVEIPLVEQHSAEVFTMLAITDELTMSVGEETVDELNEGLKVSDLIEEFATASKNGYSFVKVKFTDAGRDMVAREKENLTTSDATDTTTALNIKIGDETMIEIYSDTLMDNNREARVLAVEKENKDVVKLYTILFNSLLDNEFNVSFDSNRIEARTFEPVYGDVTVTYLYIALGVVLLAALVLPAIKMGRFGIVSAYANLSYFIIVGICYKYLLGSVFELTLGGILIFLVGLVLINALQAYIYAAIKKEFALGKTVESAVKGGYKKTIMTIVDIFAVMLLGALALLIGVGGVSTLAIHALIVIVTGAFCNLLWARVINYVFLSASKNKFRYFRFVREEDDDDDE